MSLRTSLKNLIRRDPAASLRERAASLQTDLARVTRQPVAETAEPEAAPDLRDAELLALQSEWEARAAAFNRALEEQGTITDNAPSVETPPSREPFEDWVRLIPGWRERTGVDAAEAATADAMGDLCEIENRISNMPAATLAGLKLKARVAQRNEEVSWPEGLEESLVRDILAIGEPEIEADVALLRLGRQFEVARIREAAACEACNEAQREANRLMPERPAALFYRASDERLNVLPAVTAALWRAYGEGKVTEAEAESLSVLIEERRLTYVGSTRPKLEQASNPAGTAVTEVKAAGTVGAPRRTVDSRPRTNASMERRRRWRPLGACRPVSRPGSRWPSRRSSPSWRPRQCAGRTAVCRSRTWLRWPVCAARPSRTRSARRGSLGS